MSEAPKIQSKAKVLEEGDSALIEGSQEAEILSEGDDDTLVSFDDLAGGDSTAPAAAAAAKKPEEKKVEEKKPAAAVPAADDELPEEYKGKTPAQIAKMHREAQAALGRQGTELGELRRTADLALRLAAKHQQPAADPAAKPFVAPEEAAIFAKPVESINSLIENHPLLKQIKDSLGQAAADTAARNARANAERFRQAHPDYQELLADTEFRQWVSASPVRQQLLVRADKHFDFHAGDEVFSTWKALRGVKQPVASNANDPATVVDGAPSDADVKAAAQTLQRAKAAKSAREAAENAAAVPSGGGSTTKPTGSKKVYRRADLIRLAVEDPDRYEALGAEIDAAYRENRVR